MDKVKLNFFVKEGCTFLLIVHLMQKFQPPQEQNSANRIQHKNYSMKNIQLNRIVYVSGPTIYIYIIFI